MATARHEHDINPDEISVEVSRMWVRLAKLYADAVPDIFIGGNYEEAMRVTWLAEAAYWQASGDAHSPSAKEIAAPDKQAES